MWVCKFEAPYPLQRYDCGRNLKLSHVTMTTPHLGIICHGCREAESSFLWDSDSDSGLKSDTDSWTCVIVTVYWVNDAELQTYKFSRFFKQFILLRSYLNLISVIACSHGSMSVSCTVSGILVVSLILTYPTYIWRPRWWWSHWNFVKIFSIRILE